MNITYKPNSRSKYIRITIHPNKEVKVTYPKLYPLFLVKTYITTKQGWIQKQLQKIPNKHQCPKGYIHFLGECTPFNLETVNKKTPDYNWKNNQLTFQIPILRQKDKKVIHEITELFYKQEAKKLIPDLVTTMTKKLNTRHNGISFKKQKTRWGSCSSKKNLNFNYLVMREKKEIIEYLVAHEVSHLKEMNHSKKFWALVKQLNPNYKQNAKYLRSIQTY